MSVGGVPLGTSFLPEVIGNWVPGVRPLEPFPAFNFAVEVDGLVVGGFTKVSGLQSRLVTEAYREGGVLGPHHLVTGAEPENLVLEHGLTSSIALWNWHAAAVAGHVRRRDGSIVLLDRRQLPVMWWNFRGGLPVRWTGPEFDAGADQVGFESVEIAHEGLSVPAFAQALAVAHGVSHMVGA